MVRVGASGSSLYSCFLCLTRTRWLWVAQDEDIVSDGSSGLIDVDAEWKAISAGESFPGPSRVCNALLTSIGDAGTHAPTGVSGYRTLIEASLADERRITRRSSV